MQRFISKAEALSIDGVNERMLKDIREGETFIVPGGTLYAVKSGAVYRYALDTVDTVDPVPETAPQTHKTAPKTTESTGSVVLGGLKAILMLKPGQEIVVGRAVAGNTDAGYGVSRTRKYGESVERLARKAEMARKEIMDALEQWSPCVLQAARFLGLDVESPSKDVRRKAFRKAERALIEIVNRTGKYPSKMHASELDKELTYQRLYRVASSEEVEIFKTLNGGHDPSEFTGVAGMRAWKKVWTFMKSEVKPMPAGWEFCADLTLSLSQEK